MIHSASYENLPATVEIYNEDGMATTASYDVELATLEERTARFERPRNQGHPVLALEKDDRVAGFASYGPFRNKAAYRHTAEYSVHVTGGSRSDGAGRMLLGALLDYAQDRGAHVMIGALDVDNAVFRAFHKSLGFVESVVLSEVDRKFGRWLDTAFVAHCFD